MADAHKNFAYSTVATIPSPPLNGTSLIVGSGDGTKFPTVPFNATIWPASTQPTSTNAEIVTVTAVSTDTLTIVRAQENSNRRYITAGDQIAATITNKTLTDAENVASSWFPYIINTGAASGAQTLNSGTGSASTGSVFVFPVTVPKHIQFNQILLANSLTIVTSNNTVSNSYYSNYGIYSMNANTLSLISSSSFSIGETIRSASATWNYPTTTMTSGYGYGNFPSGNLTATVQMSQAVAGQRVIGLQFGGNMRLSPGIYWIGLLSLRSTGSVSTFGMSHAGILGQIVSPINSVGSVSGLLPIGLAGSQWTASNSHSTGWFGRHIIGFITATSITNQLGTAIPSAITLSALGGVALNSTGSVLPMITFVST